MKCSCPDWAGMCKHLAACLYGIGARLDHKPELLFTLRGVNPGELISVASAAQAVEQSAAGRTATAIADGDLSDIFGIEIDPAAGAVPAAKRKTTRAKAKGPAPRKLVPKRARLKAKLKKPAYDK
jgi:uncharacterized Zn finger protein